MARSCLVCGKRAYSDYCMQHKPHKRIPKIGRVTAEVIEAVDAWKLTQHPDRDGMYTCYIGGDKVPYLVAEHPYSKARHPELRATQKFEPVCNYHNRLKGSLDIDIFLEKYPEFKETVKIEYLSEVH